MPTSGGLVVAVVTVITVVAAIAAAVVTAVVTAATGGLRHLVTHTIVEADKREKWGRKGQLASSADANSHTNAACRVHGRWGGGGLGNARGKCALR